MDIVSRLKLFMDAHRISVTQFADACVIPRPSVSQMLSGRNRKVSDEVITKIHNAYPGLSMMWLLFGEGSMDSAPASQGQPADGFNNVSQNPAGATTVANTPLPGQTRGRQPATARQGSFYRDAGSSVAGEQQGYARNAGGSRNDAQRQPQYQVPSPQTQQRPGTLASGAVEAEAMTPLYGGPAANGKQQTGASQTGQGDAARQDLFPGSYTTPPSRTPLPWEQREQRKGAHKENETVDFGRITQPASQPPKPTHPAPALDEAHTQPAQPSTEKAATENLSQADEVRCENRAPYFVEKKGRRVVTIIVYYDDNSFEPFIPDPSGRNPFLP